MIVTAAALAFDMDGTLIDSGPLTAAVWAAWAGRLGLDAAEVIGWAGGRPIPQIVDHFAPFADPDSETEAILKASRLHEDALRPMAGAPEMLASLRPAEWALVTSAEPELARRWMQICGLPSPEVVVTAADVAYPKPDPDPYLRAALQMNRAPQEMIAFEDSAAGLASAGAAGMQIVGIGGAQGSLASWPDYRGVTRHPGPGIALERHGDATRA